MLAKPPLSLYVHVPWCIRKCPYCDFNSHESNSPIPEQEYIEALSEDLAHEFSRIKQDQRELHSIFIGGGTPSIFSGDSYKTLLNRISDQINFSSQIEITLEANPGTVEAEKFSAYYEAGINRLSLGIQSFDDGSLEKLGRIHNSEEALRAIAIAKAAGFENLNLDLMHGLPGQESAQALNDLQIAISSKPTHISWYQLTIEPNTVFYRYPPQLPHEAILDEIQLDGQKLLDKAGYQHYEVSAFTKPEHASLHNKNYWSFGDYLGIGAGAHGKLTLADENRLIRTRKQKQPKHYLDNQTTRDAELVDIAIEERSLEFLMNALRLREGFSQGQYESRTGLSFSGISKGVEYQIEKGLMQRVEVNGEATFSTTATGYRFLNSVLEGFL
jgi:putative oxygen-independent coproporphyrinogen III oxidase